MKRRSFLKHLASAGVLLPSIQGIPAIRAFAQPPADLPLPRGVAGNGKVVVIVRLFGGNDGLNTLVPFTDDRYYKARGRGTGFDVSVAPESVLPVHGSSTLGFHPSFAPLAALHGEGKMVIVQNVGYPNQDLSHFRSTDIWLSGSDADVYRTSGWYARYLEAKHPSYPAQLPDAPFTIEMGTYIGTTLIGERGDMGVALSDAPFVPQAPAEQEEETTNAGIEEAFVRETLRQSRQFLDAITGAYQRQGRNLVEYPQGGDPLTEQLATIARLIAGGLGTELYILNVDGFDTHFDQPKRHGYLLHYIATAMEAFQRDIEALGLADRVCMMTISEFGRRVESNGTGTDHGAAAPMFIIGTGVASGIIGSDPDLEDLDSAGNLKMQFDFRQIYASVLGQWLGAEESAMVPHAFPRRFEQLPIFSSSTTVSDTPNDPGGMILEQNVPNPATTSTTVRLGGIPGNGTGTLSLHTMEGRLLLTREVRGWERAIHLDLRDIPAGSYLYTLRCGALNRSRVMTVRR